MARALGYAAWEPTRAVETIVAQVKSILGQYAAYGPMTVRQLFYRLVATVAFPKTEADYKRLAEYIGRARRSQLIGFDQIRDDGDTLLEPDGWRSVASFGASVRHWVKNYTLRPDVLQPVRQLLMVEASGMAPMVGRTAHRFGADVMSAGGFNGITGKHALAESIVRLWKSENRSTTVLHIGDHDPSGVHVFTNLEADVGAFVADQGYGYELVEFRRIAITEAQVLQHGFPTAPAKVTDNRSFAGIGGDPTATAQAEAIDPPLLAQIIEAALLVDWDANAAAQRDALEEADKERLERWLKRAGAI